MPRDHPGLSSIPGGQPMLRRRFYVPSAIVSYGATRFSAVHESQLHPHPPTRLAIILHNLAHQLFEEVLTGHATLTVS